MTDLLLSRESFQVYTIRAAWDPRGPNFTALNTETPRGTVDQSRGYGIDQGQGYGRMDRFGSSWGKVHAQVCKVSTANENLTRATKICHFIKFLGTNSKNIYTRTYLCCRCRASWGSINFFLLFFPNNSESNLFDQRTLWGHRSTKLFIIFKLFAAKNKNNKNIYFRHARLHHGSDGRDRVRGEIIN